jgi:hypothetical protein
LLDVILSQNKTAINHHLASFKERGAVKYDAVLMIPKSERIPTIVASLEGRMKVVAALSASMRSAFENLNLRVGMTSEQMIDLAEQVIEQSAEDNLAIEDVLLFLQQLITGKAGKIYDRMDMPTFFELFETYRQERHEKLVVIREEQRIQQKTYGDDGTRLSDNQDREKELTRSAIGDYLRDMQTKNQNG